MPRNIFRREQTPDPRVEAQRDLSLKPFISPSEISHDQVGLGVVNRRVTVPLDKIISADFGDWSTGDAVKRTAEGQIISSLDLVLSLAANPSWMSYRPNQDNIIVAPFADQAGNIWYEVENGKHRIAAAKLAQTAATELEVDVHLPSVGQAIGQYAGIIVLEEDIAYPDGTN